MTQSDLTARELEALRLLERKHVGEPVAFVNISDARALTELGLATRSRQGWDITADGVALLRSGPAAADPAAAEPGCRHGSGAEPGDPPLSERGEAIVEGWRRLRALLIEQLDALDAGGLQAPADDPDIAPRAMTTLRREVAEFDALLAAAAEAEI